MSKKYLDDTGLSHFWDKIKAKISGDISAEAGKLIPYGYCTTAAKTATKTVTVSPTITAIETGLTIAVKFQYANGVANPTLNVNGLGAHAIKRYGTTAPSTSAASSWNANEVMILVYDGTYWQTADWLNTTYSAMTDAEITAGTGTTARVITPAKLKTAIEHWATGEANVQSDWEQTDDTADDFIKNKPTIPTVPTNVSAFTNDAGYITGYTETDPVFTASPAHGITASDISNWNGKSDFSGSYNDLTNKPIYFGTCPTAETETVKIVTLDDADDFSLEAGAKIAVSFVSRHNPYDSTPKLNVNNTGVRDIVFPQIGYPTTSITELCGWSQYETVYFKYTGSKWLMFTSSMAMSILFQRDESRADWEETDNSSLSYIHNKPNVPVRVYGTTQTKTPTEVKEALCDGNIVEIVHEDQTFSFLTFFSFNYSWAFGLLISNTLIDYQGSTYLYTLVGNTNNDSWFGSATPMAKLSDIPTIPTNVSSFANDAGYLTSYTETDPTVPAWAKASTKPSYTASEVGALASTGGQVTGDITLYVDSGNSPAIIFQRGTLTDNYNDWKIYDKSGFLYFAQRGSGSSAFGDVGYINTSGVAYFHVPWSYIDSKPTFATVATSGSYNDLSDKPTALPTVTSSDNGKVLRVVDGAWSAVALPSASGVSF